MKSNWESLKRISNGKISSIKVDTAICSQTSEVEFLYSHSLLLEFVFIDEETLLGLEKSLEQAFNQAEMGHYVGQISVDGTATFFYYIKADASYQKLLDELSVTLVVKEEADETWKHYHQLLYPTVKEWQSIENVMLCQKLINQGDDLDIERTIFHKLQFVSEYKKRDLIEELEEEGFVIGEDLVTKAGYNGFSFSRNEKPLLENINKLTTFLHETLDVYDAKYDGWETSLITTN